MYHPSEECAAIHKSLMCPVNLHYYLSKRGYNKYIEEADVEEIESSLRL